MRLSVDLSKYFTDHRSLAYIFVNNKTMQHIKDVEERISNIFNIENFYLLQQDHYLPPLEEISILINDDDLCVIPLKQTNFVVSDECETNKKKKKKKKKTTVDEIIENCEVSKKIRKRKLNEEHSVDASDSELKSNKLQDELVWKKPKINNLIVHPKQRIETFKEHLDKILVKKDVIIKRSPNIVKTIIVSSNNFIKSDNKMNDSSTDSSSTTDPLVNQNKEEVIEQQPKRRRIRTRKRRRIVNNEETITQHPNEPENITPKLCLPKATGSHIRFYDDGQIDEAKLQTQEKHQEIIVENGVDKNTIINSIKDDFILKQPLIVDFLPKTNDLIAFKMLRLNETYTPELSPFIIGKVITFNNDDKEITFDVKQGLDYCLPPQGKFSIAEEDEEVIDDNNCKHTFKWSDLVEPRLIYP